MCSAADGPDGAGAAVADGNLFSRLSSLLTIGFMVCSLICLVKDPYRPRCRFSQALVWTVHDDSPVDPRQQVDCDGGITERFHLVSASSSFLAIFHRSSSGNSATELRTVRCSRVLSVKSRAIRPFLLAFQRSINSRRKSASSCSSNCSAPPAIPGGQHLDDSLLRRQYELLRTAVTPIAYSSLQSLLTAALGTTV